MACRLCNKDKQLIKAHIIPEFLYKDLKLYSPDSKGQGRLHGIRNTNGNIEHLKKGLPSGIYDSSILCKDCDSKILKEYDDYGKFIFTSLLRQRNRRENLDFIEFEISNYFLFKAFFISVFWRASISSRPEFSIVNLNNFDSRLKDFLNHKEINNMDEFEIVILYLNNGYSDDFLCNFIEINKLDTYFYSFIAGGFLINLFPYKNKFFEIWKDFIAKDEKIYKIPIVNDTETSKYIINTFIDSEILK